MPYSPNLRAAVGDLRAMLKQLGIGLQEPLFAQHGEHEPTARAPLVLVACSGGRDSMALAAVTSIVCGSLGVRSGAVIVDHGLQEGSHLVATQAAQRCTNLKLNPVEVLRVQVRPSGKGVEADARHARYEALVHAAKDLHASLVLLGHTQNDQAETVLMDLLRTSGLDAVSGMPDHFLLDGVGFARPFLKITRSQTTGICTDLELSWWDDPTNGENHPMDENLPAGYPLRSRIRHSLLPYLEEFNGGDLVGHLAHGAYLAQQDREYLDKQAGELAGKAIQYESELPLHGSVQPSSRADARSNLHTKWARLSVEVLSEQHPALRLRVIAQALAGCDLPIFSRHVESIDRLITQWHGQGPISLPSGYSAIRKKQVILLWKDKHYGYR